MWLTMRGWGGRVAKVFSSLFPVQFSVFRRTLHYITRTHEGGRNLMLIPCAILCLQCAVSTTGPERWGRAVQKTIRRLARMIPLLMVGLMTGRRGLLVVVVVVAVGRSAGDIVITTTGMIMVMIMVRTGLGKDRQRGGGGDRVRMLMRGCRRQARGRREGKKGEKGRRRCHAWS